MQFEWRVNGTRVATLGPGDINGTGWFQKYFNNPNGNRLFSMGPGETVAFSLKNEAASGTQQFWPGAFFDGMTNDVAQITGSGSETISVGLKPTQPSDAGGGDAEANSQYIDFWIRDSVKGWPWYEHRGEILSRAGAPFIQQMRTIDAADVPSVRLAFELPATTVTFDIKAADSPPGTPVKLQIEAGKNQFTAPVKLSAGRYVASSKAFNAPAEFTLPDSSDTRFPTAAGGFSNRFRQLPASRRFFRFGPAFFLSLAAGDLK